MGGVVTEAPPSFSVRWFVHLHDGYLYGLDPWDRCEWCGEPYRWPEVDVDTASRWVRL